MFSKCSVPSTTKKTITIFNYPHVDILTDLNTPHSDMLSSMILDKSFRYCTAGFGTSSFPCYTVFILIHPEVHQYKPRFCITHSTRFVTQLAEVDLHVKGEWCALAISEANLRTVWTRYVCKASIMSMHTMVTIQRSVCILPAIATRNSFVF